MTDNNNNNNNNNMKRRKEKIQNETIPYHDIRFKSTETVGYVGDFPLCFSSVDLVLRLI